MMPTDTIEITFDGKKLLVRPGLTILQVAEAQGVRIPRCATTVGSIPMHPAGSAS